MGKFLAIDLGAESGRAVLGIVERDRLRLEEIHRFPNGPVNVLDRLHWDVLRLWNEIQTAIGLAAAEAGGDLHSVGLDTWGVDFGLLDSQDGLLGNPYHYRDSRTDGMMERAFERVPRAEIFEQTGIQFMQLNTLYQLLAMVEGDDPTLPMARTLLTMPDLFNYWLTGRKTSEFTIATTTQCYDPRTGDWAWSLLERLKIPGELFGDVIDPGTEVGQLREPIAEASGCRAIPVIAPATHDTGSAVAAVPAEKSDHIYLSSGTWSLMGVEVDRPVINQASLESNLTNEGGVGGTFRLLKNIMGLWLIQECRREWRRSGRDHTYDELTQLAAEAPSFGPLVVPDDPRFLPLGDMVARIQSFCAETGQRAPKTKGEIVRCALESLALEYRRVAEQLDEIAGRVFSTIHIIGGGSQNALLNQYTADATGRLVLAGPVEATSIGNVLVQAMAAGELESLGDARALVRRSFDVLPFEPRERDRWDHAYAGYIELHQALNS